MSCGSTSYTSLYVTVASHAVRKIHTTLGCTQERNATPKHKVVKAQICHIRATLSTVLHAERFQDNSSKVEDLYL
jgi:hypothetical protein